MKVKRKFFIYGWLVLAIPMSIVVGVKFFLEELPWVKAQSSRGAQAEALTSNSLGLISMNEGRYQEAYSQFMFSIQTKPDFAEPYMNLGILSHKMGNENAAIQFLWQSIEQNPKKKDMIYNNLGLVYAARADYDTAKVMFQKALEFGLRPAPIWKNIGQVVEMQGNIPAAIEAYANSIKYRPTLKNMYEEILTEELYAPDNEEFVEKIRAQLDRGITDDDVAPYDSVIVNYFLERDPKVAENYKDLAMAYEKNGQLNEAIYNFRQALKIRPDWSAIHNRIGIIFAKNEKYPEAEEEFKQAIQTDPGNDDAKRNLEFVKQKSSEKL